MSFFFYWLTIDIAIYNKLVCWHFILYQQIGTIKIVSKLPYLKTVSVIDNNEFSLTIDPVTSTITDLMFELTIKFTRLQLVKTKIGCKPTTD
jgi:hypothetical protein